MSILYEDRYIVCDEDAITIHWYYFPLGSKRIPYAAIRSVTVSDIGSFSGARRIWGMGLSPEWFHLDPQRPSKTKCIILDEGNWIKSALTPESHEAVLQILEEKARQIN